MPHGKAKEGIDVVSTKIESDLKNEIDNITRELGYETRSDTIRMILRNYINDFNNKD